MKTFLFCGAALSLSLMLFGCSGTFVDGDADSADYSPRYSYISMDKGDGKPKQALVPEACFSMNDGSAMSEGVKPRLPPGCANNYNLQRMVEREADLTYGRPLGPAPAAPAARAAQRYLNGDSTSGSGAAMPSGSATVPDKATIEQPMHSSGY